jgi:Divergent InlB B-repeat domain
MRRSHLRTQSVSCTALLLAAALALSCNGGAGTDANGSNNEPVLVHLSVSPSPAAVTEGATTNVQIAATRVNYTDPVTLGVIGLPAGITGVFSPPTLSGGQVFSNLAITATANAATSAGSQIGVIATGQDLLPDTTSFTLAVNLPRVSVSRTGTGSGTVTSSPSGITCGTTCAAGFPPGTSVTLTAVAAVGSVFAGWSGACTGATTFCVVTPAAPSASVAATFNSTSPSFSMSVSSNAVSMPQGGSGAATVTLTRNNGFAGAVNLAIGGVPSGLTVTANPSSVSGTTATVNISAALALGAGNYPITITATGSGVPQQIATLAVIVTPSAGGSGNVTLSFASCDPSAVPIWFAFQNGSGAWTQVSQGTASTFTFTPGPTVGIAYVTQAGTAFSTSVTYLSATEITSIATGVGFCGVNAQTGAKLLHGSVSANGATFPTIVSIGGSDTSFFGVNGPNFTIDNVPAGIRDLLASYSILGADSTTSGQRIILRRNVNYANSATIPLLDFASPEAFIPVSALETLNNLGTDRARGNRSLLTANGLSGAFFSGIGGLGNAASVVRTWALPDSMLQPGDVQVTELGAIPQGSSTAFRAAFLMERSPVSQTVTLGPALNTPTVTSLGSTPYLRLHAQLASQSAYNSAAQVEFQQIDNSASVQVSATYSGGTPANWTLDMPDLTSAGYNAAWGLKSGTTVSWQVFAAGGNFLAFGGGLVADGAQMMAAATSSPSSGVTFSRVPTLPRSPMRRP